MYTGRMEEEKIEEMFDEVSTECCKSVSVCVCVCDVIRQNGYRKEPSRRR